MNENEEMRVLADMIWDYYLHSEDKIPRLMADKVSYFRAQVTAAASNNRITVKRPFDDTPLTLPYVSSAADLAVGAQCTVLVLGSLSNSIVIGDGMISGL